MNRETQKLSLPDRELAYQQRIAAFGQEGKPNILFLGGFASDMNGTKAVDLDERCAQAGFGCLRFDYRGHGQSSGRFKDGCIGDWADDALKVLDMLTKGPQLIVGSSMGGWIGLLLARARPQRIAGFVGIAAAPDFTEDSIRPVMSASQTEAMARDGFFFEDLPPEVPPEHRLPITKKLMDDGLNQLVLRSPLKIDAPVRLIQGQKDVEVPWQTALRLADHIEQPDTRIILIKDGDHRLSRPQDLDLIWQVVAGLV